MWNVQCHYGDTRAARARLEGAMGGSMKPRVLLVDDEPAIADWLRIVLEGEGYDVGVAGDAVSAIGQMTERDFSLALVDLVLPDGDGMALLQQLKSKDPSIE